MPGRSKSKQNKTVVHKKTKQDTIQSVKKANEDKNPSKKAVRGKNRPSYDVLTKQLKTSIAKRNFGEAVSNFYAISRYNYNYTSGNFVDMINISLRAGDYQLALKFTKSFLSFAEENTKVNTSLLLGCWMKIGKHNFALSYSLFRASLLPKIDILKFLTDLLNDPNTDAVNYVIGEDAEEQISVKIRNIRALIKSANNTGYVAECVAICVAFSNLLDLFNIQNLIALLCTAEMIEEAVSWYEKIVNYDEVAVYGLDKVGVILFHVKMLLSIVVWRPKLNGYSEKLKQLFSDIEKLSSENKTKSLESDSIKMFCSHQLDLIKERLNEVGLEHSGIIEQNFYYLANKADTDLFNQNLHNLRSLHSYYTKLFIPKLLDAKGTLSLLTELQELLVNNVNVPELEKKAEQHKQQFFSSIVDIEYLEIGAGYGKNAYNVEKSCNGAKKILVNELRWNRSMDIALRLGNFPNAYVLGGDINLLFEQNVKFKNLKEIFIGFPEPLMIIEDTYLNAKLISNLFNELQVNGKFHLVSDNLRFAKWFSACVVKELLTIYSDAINVTTSTNHWYYSTLSLKENEPFCQSYFGSMWLKTQENIYSFEIIKVHG